MSEVITPSSENLWEMLRDKRLLEYRNPLVASFLTGLNAADKEGYKFVDVRVSSCRDFAQVSQQFNSAFHNMREFGENPDALLDILNDLPEGKYICNIYGTATLSRTTATQMRSVLGAHREGGVGYGNGEAIFLIH